MEQSKQSSQPRELSAPTPADLSPQLTLKIQRLTTGLRELPKILQNFFYSSDTYINDNRIMTFELCVVADLDSLFGYIRLGLNQYLISQNGCCNTFQRDEFYQLLTSELMCLISLSKFYLLQLCLVGLDIHVLTPYLVKLGPYQAVLDVVARLTQQANLLVERESQAHNIKEIVKDGTIGKLQSLQQGYSSFLFFSSAFQLDLHLYLLCYYLKKAARALDRRQRDFIFTGCLDFFDRAIPTLVRLNLHSLLRQCASLNFYLLMVHHSHDYFHLYQMIPVRNYFEYMFLAVASVVQKCLLSNTLTPFMIGVLRHYDVFERFLTEADGNKWQKYIETFIRGCVICIKSGSMDFREIVRLLQIAILKCSQDNQIFELAFECLSKPNDPYWHEVDHFFRSAVKSGYNVGMYPGLTKLDGYGLYTQIKNALYQGIVNLNNLKDTGKVKKWLELLDKNKYTTEEHLLQKLEENLKKLDLNFSLARIHTIEQCEKANLSINVNEFSEACRILLTTIRLLDLSGRKLLSSDTFRRYLLLVVTMYKKSEGYYLIEYILLSFPDSHVTFRSNLELIDEMQPSEKFLEQIIEKAAGSNSLTTTLSYVIYYVLHCLAKGQLPRHLLRLVQSHYFSEIYAWNKTFWLWELEGRSMEWIKYRQYAMYDIFCQKYLCYLLSKFHMSGRLYLSSPRWDMSHPATLSTLAGYFKTHCVFLYLPADCRRFICFLADRVMSSWQPTSPMNSINCLKLLDSLSQRYPTIDYQLLQYPVLLPYQQKDYFHFGLALLDLSQHHEEYFAFLRRLLQSRAARCHDGQTLIGRMVLPTVINQIVKKIKQHTTEKQWDKVRKSIRQLSCLYVDMVEDVDQRLKSILPALISTIELAIANSAVYHTPYLVNLHHYITYKFHSPTVLSKLRRDVMHSTLSTKVEVPLADYPQQYFVIVGQYASGVRYDNTKIEYPKEPLNLDQIKLASREPTKQYSLCYIRYPTLPYKHLCYLLNNLVQYFKIEQTNCLIYNSHNANLSQLTLVHAILLNTFRLLQGNKYHILKLISTIGYVKLLNQKPKDLGTNIPADLTALSRSQFRENTIICSLLQLHLGELNIGELLHSQAIYVYMLYDGSLSEECLNNIQKTLRNPNVMHLSQLVQSNPENYRMFISSFGNGIEKMNIGSKILSYHEYVKLTDDVESDQYFLDLFEIYQLNWKFYSKILNEKREATRKYAILSLHYKKLNGIADADKECQKYLETSDVSLIQGLRYVMQHGNISEVLRRHSELYRDLSKKESILARLDIIRNFEQICKLFTEGYQLPPDFAYHNRYNSRLLYHNSVYLSKIVERWKQTVNSSDRPIYTQEVLKSYIDISKMVELRSSRETTQYDIQKGGKLQDDMSLWYEHVTLMRKEGLLDITASGSISFTKPGDLLTFRLLGCLLGNLLLKGYRPKYKFTALLAHYICRYRLPWYLVRAYNPEAYQKISEVVSMQSMKDSDLHYDVTLEGKLIELIPYGSYKRVNNYNKLEYCNLIAVRVVLPQEYLNRCFVEFFNGVHSLLPVWKLPPLSQLL